MAVGGLKINVEIKSVEIECRMAMRSLPCRLCGHRGDSLDTYLKFKLNVLGYKSDEWIRIGVVCESCRAKIKEVL